MQGETPFYSTCIILFKNLTLFLNSKFNFTNALSSKDQPGDERTVVGMRIT